MYKIFEPRIKAARNKLDKLENNAAPTIPKYDLSVSGVVVVTTIEIAFALNGSPPDNAISVELDTPTQSGFDVITIARIAAFPLYTIADLTFAAITKPNHGDSCSLFVKDISGSASPTDYYFVYLADSGSGQLQQNDVLVNFSTPLTGQAIDAVINFSDGTHYGAHIPNGSRVGFGTLTVFNFEQDFTF